MNRIIGLRRILGLAAIAGLGVVSVGVSTGQGADPFVAGRGAAAAAVAKRKGTSATHAVMVMPATVRPRRCCACMELLLRQ